jgi:hypothetical protein
MPLPIGARVRVRRDPVHGPGPWPNEPLGTIGESLDGASFSLSQTVNGPMKQYWVVFDEPQEDADGDGPYAASDVLAIYIEPIDDRVRDEIL